MANNFAMMMRVQGDVSVDAMQAALGKIRVRHLALVPALASGAAGADASFPLSVFTACGENDWIDVVRSELGQDFPMQLGPFGRFILLQRAKGFDLVATFHHRYSDGISGMFVMRDLLQALSEPDLALIPIPAPPQANTLIPRPLLADAHVQRKVAWAVFKLRMRVMREKLHRRFFSPKPVSVSTSQGATGELPLEEQFVILPTRLTLAQTSALVARCKEKQVSVHTAICVAWLQAFAAEPTETTRFGTVSSPVNIRERLSSPVGDTSGPFLSIVKTHVDCAPERDFWTVAREFKQRFSADLRDEVLFFRSMIMSQIFTKISPGDREIVGRMLFRGGVNYDFSITNLGRIPIPERSGSLYVEAFYGPLVNSSPNERTVGVSTLGGQMSLSFIFRKSKINPVVGQELMDRAIRILMEATK